MPKKSTGRVSPEEGEDTRSYPLLVVPGWGAPRFHTRWIARNMESQGFEVVEVTLPLMGVGDMKHSAEILSENAQAISQGLGVPRVNLIGYSLGGLIARIYLQEYGGYERIGRAVFVGAPQDGLYTAYPAVFTPGGRQVRKGSAFMKELNRSRPCDCEEHRCLSIYLARDGIICPSRSARLPCGYNVELTWPVFHWGIVFNRKVMKTAAEFLEGRVPSTAVPGTREEQGGRC